MFRIILIVGLSLLWLQKLHSQEINVFRNLKLDSIPSERQLKGLMAALQDSSKYVRFVALNRLLDSPWEGKIPKNKLSFIASQIDTSQISLTISGLKVLRAQESLSDKYLVQIAGMLNSKNKFIRSSAVEILGEQKSLSDKYLVQIAALLKDEMVYKSALYALGRQESLSDKYLIQIAALLNDEDENVRRSAAEALGKQELLSDKYLMQIAALLNDENWIVRQFAVSALGKQESLSDKYLIQIVNLLKDKHLFIRRSAADALGRQESLSDKSLIQIAALLNDKDENVRSSAAEALGKQESLSDKYLMQIAALLSDKYENVRRSAADALKKQGSLSDKVQEVIITLLLKDSFFWIRYFALHVLEKQESLPDKYLTQIAALLNNKDHFIRQSAIESLRGQKSLSDKYLIQIAALLNDKGEDVRISAVNALGKQESLSDKYLIQIADLLNDKGEDVRISAVNALGKQESLSDKYLIQIAALLNDEDEDVRGSAADALRKQESLSDKYLMQIVALLKDGVDNIRNSAINTLGYQKSVSEKVQNKIAGLLNDKEWVVRYSATEALGKQKSLSDKYLIRIADLLRDKNLFVRQSAVSAFGKQESLSDKYLIQIAVLLKDAVGDVRRSAWQNLYSKADSIWYYALPSVINHAYKKDEKDNMEGSYQSRVPLYEVFGGNDSLTYLLKWLCRPEKYPSIIPIDEARITLELMIGLKDYMEDNPLFSEELGKALPELIRVVESKWSLADLPNLEEARLITKEKNPDGAVYIQERINKLKSRRWINRICWILSIHFLLWVLLFLAYPYVAAVRKNFFWNPVVRKWGGFFYVNYLILGIPFLRRYLFRPYKDMLLLEAFPNNWQEKEYFPDSKVYSIKERKVLPVSEALSSFKGQVILQGESGLGKTMFLRNLASSSSKIFVYLPASKCTQGLINAINQKIPEAATDPAFLQQLIYAGSLDVLVDGLNEISARAHAQLTNEIEKHFKGNLLLTTQPMEWEPPAMAQTFRLQPLAEEQIKDFLLTRYPYMDQDGLLPESAYLINSTEYLKQAFDSKLDAESLKSNLLTLSNPMDLALVSLLIARGENPSLLDLQDQQYRLMAEAYKYKNLGNEFPLSKFSSVVYKMRVDDQPEIPAGSFKQEILSMERWKMVISRQLYQENQDKPSKHWYFRHDKIMDYFLVQEFLAHPELCEKHLDDPRFRGVYFLLAYKLEYEDAMSLREQIIQHAADTKDHSLSDNFIQLIRGRRKPRKKILETFREDVYDAIAHGQSDKAIQLLQTHTNGEHEETLALLMNRDKELNKEIIGGTISSENARLERNNINKDIIKLANLID